LKTSSLFGLPIRMSKIPFNYRIDSGTDSFEDQKTDSPWGGPVFSMFPQAARPSTIMDPKLSAPRLPEVGLFLSEYGSLFRVQSSCQKSLEVEGGCNIPILY
jgi:hypothetical protein